MYPEEEWLSLSGLQHFKFCRRQWALIHIEQLWAENYRTADGSLMHQRAHDADLRESRGDLILARGMQVFSPILGISGQCDVVEFRRAADGVPLRGRDGCWHPFPVEYKRGSPNDRGADELQLCAQAMCLEEMLCTNIQAGALYYGETRHRQEVIFTQTLRAEVQSCLQAMHDLYHRGYTPRVKPSKACNACSLKDACLPRLMNIRSVTEYLQENMEGMS